MKEVQGQCKGENYGCLFFHGDAGDEYINGCSNSSSSGEIIVMVPKLRGPAVERMKSIKR